MYLGIRRGLALGCLLLSAWMPPAATAATTASTLAATSSGSTVSGTLKTSAGTALANATVSAYALDVTARGGLSWRQYSGTVPTGAVYAVLGVRGGTEGATISAAGGASIGGVWYVEPTTGLWSDTSPVSQAIAGIPDSVRTYALTPGQTISSNLGAFYVTSGQPYAIYMAIAATGNAANAGYLGVIFYNAKGVELRRDKIWFTSAQVDLGSVTTNSSGQYTLSVPADVAALYPEIHLSYAGGTTTLASTLTVASRATAAQVAMPALAQQLPTAAQLGGKKMGWFTPREDFLGQLVAGATWDQLLAKWSTAAGHIQVIRLPTAVLLEIPDATLQSMVQAMDSHGLALSLEIGPTNWYNQTACGSGVESYSDPGTANLAVEKLLDAGAKLSAIEMDEPLYFGHYYSGANACRSSIQEEAQRAAVIVKIFTAAFPNLVVGDIEPFPAISQQANWQSDYAAWLAAFSSASGSKIAFLQLDFDWGAIPVTSAAIAGMAQQAAAMARTNGLKVGMILNGTQSAGSDALYTATARFHMDSIVASGINPDQLLFITWATWPTLTIPETTATTLTGHIDYYFANYN